MLVMQSLSAGGRAFSMLASLWRGISHPSLATVILLAACVIDRLSDWSGESAHPAASPTLMLITPRASHQPHPPHVPEFFLELVASWEYLPVVLRPFPPLLSWTYPPLFNFACSDALLGPG